MTPQPVPPARRTTRFGLWYHLRNPARWHQTPEDLYQMSVDQAAWAEQIGFDSIWASEHHFDDDGYTPSPVVYLAAVAAKTTRVRLATNLVVAPLHHPLRLAEDTSSLAILSRGRFDLGVGTGYSEQDFAAFGRKLSQRPSLIEDATDILRRAWAGEPVGGDRRRFPLPNVRVTPVPAEPPRLLMGGAAPQALDRAARLADGYLPPARPGHPLTCFFGPYLDAVERHHGDRAAATLMCGMPAIIAEDPERTFAAIGEHVLYQVNSYIARGTYGDVRLLDSPCDVITAGYFRLWDAAVAIDKISALLKAYPEVEDIHWWAQFPGESVDSGSERAAYLADRVLPALRALNVRA